MNLWTTDEFLDIMTIVKIWLLLNFTVFGVHNLSELVQSNFHLCADNYLSRYRQVQCKTVITSSDLYFENVLDSRVSWGKIAPPKNSESLSVE